MKLHYQDNQGEPIFVEIGKSSAVRSHHSYDPQVEAVCHHSGSYLTRSEVYPRRSGLLREQHDFPGFPELDREFAKAAHRFEHQHLIWSQPGVKGVACILSGILLLAASASVFVRRDQINAVIETPGIVEFVIIYSFLIIGVILGIALLLWGAIWFWWRTDIYHRQAVGQPPVIADFPLLRCSYDIIGQERLLADLGNERSYPHTLLPSTLMIDIYPDANSVGRLYQQYQQIYRQHSVGTYFNAGSLALEQLQVVECPTLDLDHRLVFRAPIPDALEQGSYKEGPLVRFTVPYTVLPQALYGKHGEQMLLECLPQLAARDSRTLELHFRWRGNADMSCRLEECKLLDIPAELGAVERVEFGRFDAERQEIVWRNLEFQNQPNHEQVLVLSVSFSKPILHSRLLEVVPVLHGSYRCMLDGFVSGIQISPERIWNALGRKAVNDKLPISIQGSSTIEGDLKIDIRHLSQEHECVLADSIHYHSALEHDFVTQVLRVLVEMCQIDLQRIEQAMPRLDPAGTLQTQLRYWDIVGRRYDLNRLDSIDVHAVISGYDQIIHESAETPHTSIELRVRCLRDPRNTEMEQIARTLLNTLGNTIQQELGTGISQHLGDKEIALG